MNFKKVLFAAGFVISALTVKAQTADEIIQKNIDATGGKDKLAQITSIYMEASMEVMGNNAPVVSTVLNGKGAKTEIEINGSKMINCVTDKGGWSINPMMGSSDPTAMPEDQYKISKDQIWIAGPLFNYAEKGYKVEAAGQEMIGGVNAYKLIVTSPENVVVNYYFDPTTFNLLQIKTKANMMGQEMEMVSKFSNFKKTDFGYVYPYTSEISYGDQFSMVMNVNKIEINKPVDPAIFEMKK